MSPPVPPSTPKLPQLQSSSPLGAWLTRHLFKVVAALLLLLALLLAWLLDAHGFQLGAEGLTRMETVQVFIPMSSGTGTDFLDRVR